MAIPYHRTDLWRLLNPFHPIFTFLAGTGTVALRKYRQKRRENSAATWPSAEAVVLATPLKSKSGGYWVEISYRYYAMQEYRYGKHERHFRKKAPAAAFAETMRGRTLQIRYREDNPDTSVLTERDLEMTGALQVAGTGA